MAASYLEYYAPEGLSGIFHDLLAKLEPGCKDDVTFYLSQLSTAPRMILELGCGAGRVSLALSKQGHYVEGIDSSQTMLQLALLQADRADSACARRVNFTLADMTSFSFAARFDLVIAPYFGLNHLPSRKAVLETFDRAAEHLRPDGRFAVHVADVARLALPLAQQAATHATIQYDSVGNKLRLDIVQREFEPSTGHFAQLLRYSMINPKGVIERVSTERLAYRAISCAELADAAAQAGLAQTASKIQAGETGFFTVFQKADGLVMNAGETSAVQQCVERERFSSRFRPPGSLPTVR
jgi:SAM-dependent methyltransferase